MIKFTKNVFSICKNEVNFSKRTLFSRKTLHLEGFQKLRLNFEVKKNDSDFFFEIQNSPIPKLLTLTKLWTLRATRNKDHIELLWHSLNRIYENSSTIQEKEEVNDLKKLGPMTMRLFHHLDLPENALQFYHEFNNIFFDSNTTSYILMDLLFEHKKYNEIMEIYQIRTHERQFKASPLHRLMVYAACYKLNTTEALEHTLKLWGESVSQSIFEIDQSKRFLAMLALNQKRPEIALDVLPKNSDYTADMNINLLLMTQLGDWNGICNLLYKIKSNRLIGRRFRVYTEVARTIRDNLEKSKGNSSTHEWNRCDRFLSELWHYNLLYKVTMDQILCWPIVFKKQNETNEKEQQDDSLLGIQSLV